MMPRGALTPIVAMTAGGPGGEQTRCLAAGMSGYLTKPLFQDALVAVLHRHLKHVGAMPIRPKGPGEPVAADQPLDPAVLAVLQESLGEAGLAALIDLYRRQALDRLVELEQAVREDDPARVRQLAHQLKGESSSLGAVKVAGLALRLEQMGRDARLGEAPAAVVALRDGLTIALSSLASWSPTG